MSYQRRKYRLADSANRDVDLRIYSQIIIDTVNSTVPGKNPEVFKSCFTTDPLTHSEAVLLGRALSKLDELKGYGKTVTIFRLFDGKLCESEDSNTLMKKADSKYERKSKIKPLKGGRLR